MGGLLAPHRPRAASSDISGAPGSLHIIHVLTRLLPAGTEENTISLALRQKNEGHHVTIVFGRDFNSDLGASVFRDFPAINVSASLPP